MDYVEITNPEPHDVWEGDGLWTGAALAINELCMNSRMGTTFSEYIQLWAITSQVTKKKDCLLPSTISNALNWATTQL